MHRTYRVLQICVLENIPMSCERNHPQITQTTEIYYYGN